MSEIKVISNNKKAYHNYFILDTLETGIELVGSEVKSVRAGGISINESFVQIKEGTLWLKNAYIKPYEHMANYAPDSMRNRRLLAHKREIQKLIKQVEQKGNTLIPIKVYIKNNLVKVSIGLAKGKQLYDKRNDLKEKSIQKEISYASKMSR